MLRQPGQAFGLVPQRDRVEVQGVPGERPADQRHVVAQLPGDVLDHPVVRGGGGAKDRDGGAERGSSLPMRR